MNICCKFLLFKQSEIAPGVTMIFLSVWAWHYVLPLSSKDLDCLVPGRLHDRILQNDTKYLTWIWMDTTILIQAIEALCFASVSPPNLKSCFSAVCCLDPQGTNVKHVRTGPRWSEYVKIRQVYVCQCTSSRVIGSLSYTVRQALGLCRFLLICFDAWFLTFDGCWS